MATNIPSSNKKVFILSIIIAIVAIVGFIIFVQYNSDQTLSGVDKQVLVEHPDPAKVFDAPMPAVKLYYIDIDAKSGQTAPTSTSVATPDSDVVVGCGDGLVVRELNLDENQGGTKIDAAGYVLSKLFDNTYYLNASATPANGNADASPYNALSKSKLKLKSIKELPDGVEVRLTGTVRLGGTCDAPRAMTQITRTLEQLFLPQQVTIFLNDKPLEKAFSSR